MPFTFKPDIATEATQAAQPAPQAVFANSMASAPTPVDRMRTEGKSFFQIVLFTLFGGSVLIAAGLFAYNIFLSSRIEAKKSLMNDYESRLANLPLEEMKKLSDRMRVANQLVKSHSSANVAFLIVEASVENFVTYKKFALSYSENAKAYQLSLSGTAPSYKALAQQMDTYTRKPYSTYTPKASLDTMGLDTSGRVNFAVSMPITIQGFDPDKFYVISNALGRTVATSTDSDSLKSASSTPSFLSTTTPVGGNGSSTTQARKP